MRGPLHRDARGPASYSPHAAVSHTHTTYVTHTATHRNMLDRFYSYVHDYDVHVIHACTSHVVIFRDIAMLASTHTQTNTLRYATRSRGRALRSDAYFRRTLVAHAFSKPVAKRSRGANAFSAKQIISKIRTQARRNTARLLVRSALKRVRNVCERCVRAQLLKHAIVRAVWWRKCCKRAGPCVER